MYTRSLSEYPIPYSAKLWRIDRYRVFGEENVGEFTIATISYSSEPGIWLGKTLANDVCFAKFAKVFPHQSFALYGSLKLSEA